MSAPNKYVTVKNEYGIEAAITFSPVLSHKDVAFQFHRDDILGAGFYGFQDGHVFVEGESESLHIRHRHEDAALIAKLTGIRQ